tara:strand:+ start:696 stop:3059 length:2364 start_codon:yes stop_codon:yes gene_type:complete
MPNLVGIGNSQVPTNAMLSRFAFQDSIGEINIEKIKAETTDSATDVFVYDTRKDSDGGAWRYRTKNTSWYNEGVSATRGTRKEFPAVALIVAENNFITIYDGDDPNLPMWMVFNTIANGASQGMGNPSQSGRPMIQIQGTPKVVHMLNGILVTGTKNEGSNYGQPVINFISEQVLRMDSQSGEGGEWVGNIAQRNEALGYRSVDHDYVIKASHVNNVTMTVLPNAQIDDATRLPTPTIAVATPSGVSVIGDDKTTVVDHYDSAGGESTQVAFTQDGKLAHSHDGHTGIRIDSLKSSDFNYGSNKVAKHNSEEFYINYSLAASGWSGGAVKLNEGSFNSGGQIVPVQDNILAENSNKGLNLLARDFPSSPDDNRVAYITSNYNTGYMVGDIKGAFMSDTDDTNLDRTNLVTNGTFDSGTGWSLTGAAAPTISGGKLVFNGTSGTGLAQQAVSPAVVASGAQYTVKFTVSDYASGAVATRVANSSYGNSITANGTYYQSFVAGPSSTETVLFYGNSFNGKVDNVEVYLEEQDRSYNKKGLQVYGTITRGSVAPGADLVYYSGNGSSNYLEQPYNSDLNFGANADFCVMGWLNTPSVGGGQYIFDRSVTHDSSRDFQVWMAADLRYLTIYVAGGQVATTGNNKYPNNEWFQYCVLRKDNRCIIYINGEEVVNNLSTVSTIASSNVPTKILYNMNSNTKSALMRISATAPSPEQVKRMFDDERHLFNENAKCTLYGTSDDVKAIAYDDETNILHAGTSSGRSEFCGLNRINNTTTAVATAISASNGFIAEQ